MRETVAEFWCVRQTRQTRPNAARLCYFCSKNVEHYFQRIDSVSVAGPEGRYHVRVYEIWGVCSEHEHVAQDEYQDSIFKEMTADEVDVLMTMVM